MRVWKDNLYRAGSRLFSCFFSFRDAWLSCHARLLARLFEYTITSGMSIAWGGVAWRGVLSGSRANFMYSMSEDFSIFGYCGGIGRVPSTAHISGGTGRSIVKGKGRMGEKCVD